MEKLALKAKLRKTTGKNEAGRSRRTGMVPGNLIAEGKSTLLAFPHIDFTKLLQSGIRASSILTLDIEGSGPADVIVKEIQRHPVTGAIKHVDFYQLAKGRKVRVNVGVEPVGLSKGVKGGGALETFIRNIKVKATPETLVDVLKVDVTNMEVGDSVHLKDLPIPKDWDVLLTGNPRILAVARSRLVAETPEEIAAASAAGAASASGSAAAAPAAKS